MVKKRSSASFGKSVEYYIAGLLLREDFDVFMPLVDSDGIDLLVKLRGDYARVAQIQVKAREKSSNFRGIRHDKKRDNYFFVFYIESSKEMWLLSSDEFIEKSGRVNKIGDNEGKHYISLNQKKKQSGEKVDFEKYRLDLDKEDTFLRLKNFLEKQDDQI